jgi:hypothetical protein
VAARDAADQEGSVKFIRRLIARIRHRIEVAKQRKRYRAMSPF